MCEWVQPLILECLGSVKDESGRHRDDCVGALSLVTDGSQVLVYNIKGKFQRQGEVPAFRNEWSDEWLSSRWAPWGIWRFTTSTATLDGEEDPLETVGETGPHLTGS